MNDLESFVGEITARNAYMNYSHLEMGLIEKDHTQVVVDLVDELLNPYGSVHGGLLFTMMDCCAGMTARTDMRKYVTLDGSIHYLRGTAGGARLMADGRVVKRGRTTVIVDVRITDEEENLLATGTVTMFCIGEKG